MPTAVGRPSSYRHSCMPTLPPGEDSREDAAQSSLLDAVTAAGIHSRGDAFEARGNLVFVRSPGAADGTT